MEKEKYEFIISQLRMIRCDLQELNSKLDLMNGEAVVCDNCKEIVPLDYVSNSEAITHDGNICQQCIEDGYGA